MKIIYLHGFGSAGDSAKSRALKARFGSEHVACPDLPMEPLQVAALVREIVRENHEHNDYPLLFVGTSLGGFYANYFAQTFDVPCVLVNPSTAPHVSLAARVGWHVNYATGKLFEVKAEHLRQFEQMHSRALGLQNDALVHLFLAEDDTVIAHDVALAAFPYTRHKVVTHDGGHRYEQHWDAVVDYIAARFAGVARP